MHSPVNPVIVLTFICPPILARKAGPMMVVNRSKQPISGNASLACGVTFVYHLPCLLMNGFRFSWPFVFETIDFLPNPPTSRLTRRVLNDNRYRIDAF